MASGGQSTVLVVDDDRAIRRVLRSALERLGYRVIESPDGADALALVDAGGEALSVIVSDVGMPRLDGIGLVEGLQRRGERVPVILTSGRHTVASLPPGVRTRIAGLIAKPYSLVDVVSAVTSATRAGGALGR